MLRWLFRKRIEKAEALEAYLSHFDAGELAYMKNVTLMNLAPNSYPMGPSPSDTIDLATYIHASALAANDLISDTPYELSRTRASYRIGLARDAVPLQRSTSFLDFSVAIRPHRLEQPDLTSAEEERLGLHLTMLERIHQHGKQASLLPELEELGEARAWESSWRG